MLLVQIGLALYVIVVFLSQSADGTVTPKVLKVQKVAEANLTRLEGARAETAALNALGAPAGQSAADADFDAQIVALLAAPKTEADLAPVVGEIAKPAQSLFPYESADIYSLGSKPRAPSVVA